MACARVKPLETLLRSDAEAAIEQANLGTIDTAIAKLYLIDRMAQIDIAIEVGYDRSTISRRMGKIISRVEQTAKKMNFIS